MDAIKVARQISIILPLLLASQGVSWAKTTPQTEIQVTLLGQACSLQGPFDETTLKSIHGIGPAQVYPTTTVDSKSTSEQLRRSLDKIKNIHHLPSLFDRYREKLTKRLEAQAQFIDEFQKAKQSHHYNSLVKVGQTYLRAEDFRNYDSLIKKLHIHSRNPAMARDLTEQLFDLYNGAIEQDPEQEFHRAIKKLNIQYMCSFEESEE